MCSPVGHALAGLIVGAGRKHEKLTWPLLIFCVFSGNAADLDLVVGWMLGDINSYHHLGSHSILASLVYGLMVYLILAVFGWSSSDRIKWAVSGGIIYFSHIVLDTFSADGSAPIGLQLFWPLSTEFYASPVFLFRAFLHPTVDDDMAAMIYGIFNWHNLGTVGLEVLILMPILLIVFKYRNRFLEEKA